MKPLARRLIFRAIILVLFVPLAAALYHQFLVHRSAERFPPPGQFTVGEGPKIHFVCKGEGSPIIIYESGLGSDSALIWQRTADQTATTNKSCYYDRAGYGWSDTAITPRTIKNQAADLGKIVDRVSNNTPIILVGHSLGGMIIRAYTKENPDQVVGMLFVDSSHEDQKNRLPVRNTGPKKSTLVPRYGAYFGLMRPKANKLIPKFPWLSDALYDRLLETASQAKYHRALLAEQDAFDAYHSAPLSTHDYDFKTIPISVLSQDTNYPQTDDREILEYKKTWKALQLELADLSDKSVYGVVEKTGHLIPLFKPQEVASAISTLQQQIETPSS